MKILYVCNDLDYFVAHRLNLARSMVARGHKVYLASGSFENPSSREQLGEIVLFSTELELHQFSIDKDFRLIKNYKSLVAAIKPDVVHAITIKPILYMGIALALNKLFRKCKSQTVFVSTFAGLGKVFEPSKNPLLGLRRYIVTLAVKCCQRYLGSFATFENAIDREHFINSGLFPEKNTRMLMGAGIDRSQYYTSPKSGELTVLFASRLINAKGIDNFIAAALAVHSTYPDVIFKIAGALDQKNPDCLDEKVLNSAIAEGAVRYLGEVPTDAMPQLLRSADVLCLPTRLREGFPRILLEAASCGCALIATDQPVIRQIVIEQETGWLLQEANNETIRQAIIAACADHEKTRAMGMAAASLSQTLPIDDQSIAAEFSRIYKQH